MPAGAAGLDLVPVAGALPVRLNVSQTAAGPDGPHTTASTLELRRTGPASAVLQRNADLIPLVIDSDGTLRPADGTSGATLDPEAATLLSALNIALAVTGAPGAGAPTGWTAQIPAPQPRRQPGADDDAVPASSPSPAAPLLLPVRTIAAGTSGDLDLDGSVETTIAAPPAAARQQRSRSGGFGGGGFGGFGGRGGGRGGGYGGGEAPRGGGAPPVTLDVHVTGRIAHGALRRISIAQTRRVVIDGLTYTNVGNTTIDVRS
jgi:hypothetical protein